MTEPRRKVDFPTRDEWLHFLEYDIERLDARMSFLWALLVSSLSFMGYLAAKHAQDLQSLVPSTILMSAAFGAVVHFVVFGPIVERLVSAALPPKIFSENAPKLAINLLRYVRSHGVPISARVTNLPEVVALILMASALWEAAELVGLRLRIVLVVAVAVLVLSALMRLVPVFLPRVWTKWIGAFLATAFHMAAHQAGDSPERSAIMSELQDLKVKGKAVESVPATIALLVLKITSWITANIGYAMRLLVVIVVFLLTFGGAHAGREVVVPFALVALFVGVILSLMRVFFLLYWDNTRMLLEQMRLAVLSRMMVDRQTASYAFFVVETFRQVHFFERVDLDSFLQRAEVQKMPDLLFAIEAKDKGW